MKKKWTFTEYKKILGAAQAAANCGVSTVTYWRWETGKTKPEGNDAKRVAKLGLIRA